MVLNKRKRKSNVEIKEKLEPEPIPATRHSDEPLPKKVN